MAHKLLISEILTNTAKLLTKAEKIDYLQKNISPPLTDLLRINFDDDIISLVPEGAPPYTPCPNPAGNNHSTLYREYRKFKYFFKGPTGSALKESKRESMFILLLESVHASDAELVIACKDKSMKYKGITKIMIKDAFPNLLKL